MEEGDLIVLVAGSAQAGPQTAMPAHRKVTPAELAIYASAGLLRLALAQKYSERHGIFKKTGDPAKDFRFLWVTNFPMFEWDEGEKQWMAAHHPFTSPHEEDMSLLEAGVESVNDPQSPLSAVRALAYDVVLNGTELGSGSIRIHRQDIQSKIFRALGMTDEEAKVALRILPRSAGVRHASARRHRAGPRPHRDDSGRRRKPARSDSLPQDRARGGLDGGCADAGRRDAVAGVGDPGEEVAQRLDYLFMNSSTNMRKQIQIFLILTAAAGVLLTVPAPASIAQQPATSDASSPIEQGKFTLHKFEQPIGEETYEIKRDGDSLTVKVDFKFTDRGTAVPLSATFRGAQDLTPQPSKSKARRRRSVSIDEAVTIDAGNVHFRTRDKQSDSAAPSGPFFTIAGYAPATMQMLLVRYWATHGSPAQLATLPSGSVKIEPRGQDTIRIGGESRETRPLHHRRSDLGTRDALV